MSGGAADLPMPSDSAGVMKWMEQQVQRAMSALSPAMRAAEVPVPPEAELLMPEVYLDADVMGVASHLSDLCRAEEIYRMDREVVTIDETTGRTEAMPPARFVTWIGERVKFYKLGKKGKTYESITEQTAKLVLLSDRFKRKLRRVTAVHTVKMPVWRRTEGQRTVELLPPGYDAGSGVYTVQNPDLDYAEDLPVAEAAAFFRRLLGGFPFGDPEQGMANQLSYMLSLYMRAMVAPDKLPAYVIGANLVSSGKGILAKLGICAVYGRASTTSLSKDEELKKELDVVARHARPYVFFDDLGGTINNRDLNAWLTSTHRAGRVIGTGETFEMPTAAMLIFTGNQLKLSPDLERRRVAIDLFAQDAAPDRPEPEEPITDEWLMEPENRKKLLAGLWAMVRHAFSAEGRELGKTRRYGKPLGSFEVWSRTIPPVVLRAGFVDPLTRVVMPDSGDITGEDGKRTLQEAIADLCLPVNGAGTLTLVGLVRYARRASAFTERLHTVEEVILMLDADRNGWREEEYEDEYGNPEKRLPQTDAERRAQAEGWVQPARGNNPGMLSSFGYHIRKYCGRAIRRTNSRGEVEEYIFSDRASSKQSAFQVRRVK